MSSERQYSTRSYYEDKHYIERSPGRREYYSRERSPSPRQRIHSPRERTPSPRLRIHSPRERTPSPRQLVASPLTYYKTSPRIPYADSPIRSPRYGIDPYHPTSPFQPEEHRSVAYDAQPRRSTSFERSPGYADYRASSSGRPPFENNGRHSHSPYERSSRGVASRDVTSSRDGYYARSEFVDSKYTRPKYSRSRSTSRRRRRSRSYSRSSRDSYYKRKRKSRKAKSSSSSSSSSSDSDNETVKNKDKKSTSGSTHAEPSDAERNTMYKKREDYVMRLFTLEKEMDRLRKQQETLDAGDKNANAPFLAENLRLQGVMKGNMSAICNVVEKMSDVLKLPVPENLQGVDNKNQVTVEPVVVKVTETDKNSKQDSGQPWCQYCNVFPLTLKALLKHCSSDKHKEKLKEHGVIEAPWQAKIEPENEKSAIRLMRQQSLSGYQFLVPTEGWYCQLCHVWFGDHRCGIIHMYSEEHTNGYIAFADTHREWEQQWKSSRQIALEEYDETLANEDSGVKEETIRPDQMRPEWQQEWEDLHNRIKERKEKPSTKPAEPSEPIDDVANRSILVQMRNMSQKDANPEADKSEDIGEIDEWMKKEPPPSKWDTIEVENEFRIIKKNAFLAAGRSFKSAVEKQEEEIVAREKKEKSDKQKNRKPEQKYYKPHKQTSRSRSRKRSRSRSKKSRSRSKNRSRSKRSRSRSLSLIRLGRRRDKSYTPEHHHKPHDRRERDSVKSSHGRYSRDKHKPSTKKRGQSVESSSPDIPKKKKEPIIKKSTTAPAVKKDRPMPVIGKMPILRKFAKNNSADNNSSKPVENMKVATSEHQAQSVPPVTNPVFVEEPSSPVFGPMPNPIVTPKQTGGFFHYPAPPPPLIHPQQIYQRFNMVTIPMPVEATLSTSTPQITLPLAPLQNNPQLTVVDSPNDSGDDIEEMRMLGIDPGDCAASMLKK